MADDAARLGKNSTVPAIRRGFSALRCSKTQAGRRQAAPREIDKLTQRSELLPGLLRVSALRFAQEPGPLNEGFEVFVGDF